MTSIFLSHNSEDKEFVRDLHKLLLDNGIESWIDEAEIKIGDSLLQKISEGIKKADFVAIILSPKSIDSPWVERELEMAMQQEIERKEKKVLPLIIEDCELPEYLKIKKYGDFRTPQNSLKAINELLQILKKGKGKKTKVLIEEKKIPLTKKQMKIALKRDFNEFKKIYDIAIAPKYAGGMAVSQSRGIRIAELFSQKDRNTFTEFKKIYDIAIAPKYAGGMGLDQTRAIELALKQISN